MHLSVDEFSCNFSPQDLSHTPYSFRKSYVSQSTLISTLNSTQLYPYVYRMLSSLSNEPNIQAEVYIYNCNAGGYGEIYLTLARFWCRQAIKGNGIDNERIQLFVVFRVNEWHEMQMHIYIYIYMYRNIWQIFVAVITVTK